MDLNEVDNAVINNVSIDGNGTSGNAISLTKSPNATLTDVTTSGNNWGGVALYETSTTDTTFAGTISTAENNGIYAQQASGEITGTDFPAGSQVYLVTNDSFRPDAEEFTFFSFSQDDAVAYAQSLGASNSVIRGPFAPENVSTAAGDGSANQFIVADGMSIQKAIDAADAGDTVTVLEGTYTENVALNEDVTLQGATGETVTLVGSVSITAEGATFDNIDVDRTDGGNGISIDAKDVTVSNSAITGDDSGLGIVTEAGTLTGIVISDNAISDFTTGIYVEDKTVATITGNTLSGNVAGLANTPADENAAVSGNTFENNTSEQIGLSVSDASFSVADYLAGDSVDGSNTFTGDAPDILVVAINGADSITGSSADELFQVSGADSVDFNGGGGADTLTGSTGADILSGGSGSDQFIGTFDQLDGDKILDLSDAESIVVRTKLNGTLEANYDGDILTLNDDADTITLDITDGLTGTFSVNGDTVTYTEPTGGGSGTGGGVGGGTAGAPGDVINGTDGPDSLTGTDNADTINGLGGDDTINGQGGDDQIFSGAGNDMSMGGEGNDLIFGGEGDDTTAGGNGNDQQYGGAGNDQQAGGAGNDTLGGGAGNDQGFGGAGEDVLFGADGADTLYGGSDNDKLFGGADDDVLAGGDGDDEIGGGRGNDEIAGGAGADTIYGADGDDMIFAGSGADSVFGGSGNDTVYLGLNDGAQDVYSSTADNGTDLVYGFENGTDLLNLTANGYTSFADVSSQIGQDADGNATIDLGNGDILTLNGVAQSDLDASDFQF